MIKSQCLFISACLLACLLKCTSFPHFLFLPFFITIKIHFWPREICISFFRFRHWFSCIAVLLSSILSLFYVCVCVYQATFLVFFWDFNIVLNRPSIKSQALTEALKFDFFSFLFLFIHSQTKCQYFILTTMNYCNDCHMAISSLLIHDLLMNLQIFNKRPRERKRKTDKENKNAMKCKIWCLYV